MNYRRNYPATFGNHFPILSGRHDRYCSWCGEVIVGQNADATIGKIGTCPNAACGRTVPLRTGFNPESGWGRCPTCDAFVHKAHFFCCLCKWRNEEAFERKRRATERELKRKLEQETMEVERLKRMLTEIQGQQAGNQTAPGPGRPAAVRVEENDIEASGVHGGADSGQGDQVEQHPESIRGAQGQAQDDVVDGGD